MALWPCVLETPRRNNREKDTKALTQNHIQQPEKNPIYIILANARKNNILSYTANEYRSVYASDIFVQVMTGKKAYEYCVSGFLFVGRGVIRYILDSNWQIDEPISARVFYDAITRFLL